MARRGDTNFATGDISADTSGNCGLTTIGGFITINGTVYLINNFAGQESVGTKAAATLGIGSTDAAHVTKQWPTWELKDDKEVDKPSLKSVAVLYCSADNYRVYFQRGLAIHEVSYISGDWRLSAEIKASNAKENTPIAAVCHYDELKVHVFYLDKLNFIHEVCWDATKGWSIGPLTAKSVRVSSYSALSATCSAFTIKLYCQRGTEICELSYQLSTGDWTFRVLSDALPGSSIASICYPGEDNTYHHVYYQTKRLQLREYIYDFDDEFKSAIRSIKLPRYTPLTAISWYIDGPYIQLYYTDHDGGIQELSNDDEGKWNKILSLPGSQKVEKDSQIAALEQRDGRIIKIYHLSSEGRLDQMSFSKHEKHPRTDSVL